MLYRIIVVDDEPDIQRLLAYNLKNEGFIVETAADGITALKKLKAEKFDLMILDLMLPQMNGLELCKIVKQDKKLCSLPIIMLTAKGEEIDRVIGFELGADDYVTKPFSLRELIARIKAVLRRTKEKFFLSEDEEIIKIGNFVIDGIRFKVYKENKLIQLSAIEFKLLHHLAKQPGVVFSREKLLDEVWGEQVYVEPRTVDVHIRRLREKIEDNPSSPRYILTKRGIGYYFSEEI